VAIWDGYLLSSAWLPGASHRWSPFSGSPTAGRLHGYLPGRRSRFIARTDDFCHAVE